MGDNMAKNNSDWKSVLNEIKNDMMTPEDKEREEKERRLDEFRRIEINKRKKKLYEFLAGYKHNSGIFINNFFRDRDFETYCEDKFDGFEFDVTGIMPANLFDDIYFSFLMVNHLEKLERGHIAYYPITEDYIDHLINFAEVLDLQKPLQLDTVLYRGCSTLERNGVNGIVSTSLSKEVAEQFNRGTLLEINVPEGTKYIDIRAIRPKEQRRKDKEQEYLLPPCEYQIISDKVFNYAKGINNCTGRTRYIKMNVKTLDLLTEFLKMLENPPIEYGIIRSDQGIQYDNAVLMLKDYLEKRNRNNTELTRKLKKIE